MKPRSFDQGARALHEQRPGRPAQRSGELIDIAAQHGREVGIDQGGVAAGYQLDQRGQFMADRNLREPGLARQFGQPRLVRRIFPTVHQHDRHRFEPSRAGLRKSGHGCRLIKRGQDRTIGHHPFGNFKHAMMQRLRQDDPPHEQFGAFLRADGQRITKAASDGKQRRLTLAFQQRIGGHRGAHPHLARWQWACLRPGQRTNSRNCRVFCAVRVFGQQLGGAQRPIGRTGDNVGECPATIDPELPIAAHPAASSRLRASR